MDKDFQVGIYEKAFPEELSISEMLVLSEEKGFDFFEISIDRTDKRIARLTDSDFINSVCSFQKHSQNGISSMGLSAIGTYTLGNPDDGIATKGIQIFRDAIHFAETLGIRIIQIPGADVPKFDPRDESTKEKYLENLQKMISYAAKHGIIIGLENMENDFMDTTAKCMEVISQINSPYFQLYTDSGNLTNAFKNNLLKINSDMDKGSGHYFAFHFKEVRENKYGGLFYGDGIVNFEEIAKKAYNLGIRRFCMEYWYTGTPTWKDDLGKARELCLKWLS